MYYWTNFAKTGNPNGKELPQWQPFNEAADNPTMYLKDDKLKMGPNT